MSCGIFKALYSFNIHSLVNEDTTIGQKSIQEHISVAYACLEIEQTSLSPNVQTLLTSSISSEPSLVPCDIELLQSDMILNWQGVELLLFSCLETGSCVHDALWVLSLL